MDDLYRDVLMVYFQDESWLSRFHNKVQKKGKRPKVYTERKKFLYVAAEIAGWLLYSYDVPELKETLLRGILQELQLAA